MFIIYTGINIKSAYKSDATLGLEKLDGIPHQSQKLLKHHIQECREEYKEAEYLYGLLTKISTTFSKSDAKNFLVTPPRNLTAKRWIAFEQCLQSLFTNYVAIKDHFDGTALIAGSDEWLQFKANYRGCMQMAHSWLCIFEV